jgi:hypothetical protein
MNMEEVFAPMPPEGAKGDDQQQLPAAGQEQQEPPKGGEAAPGGEAGGGEAGAAPPAAGADASRHVPLEALEAERRGRQDWKEKAIRAEAERDQLRQQIERRGQQPPPQGEQQQEDPVQRQVQRLENVVLNQSERAARSHHGTEAVDKAWARVQQEFGQNPALYQQIVGAPDPWDQVVQHGKRLLAMDEIGSDPVAFRKKVEDEIRAQLAATGGSPPDKSGKPAAPNLPESLAGARSAGARGTTWTGPTPFENLFPN